MKPALIPMIALLAVPSLAESAGLPVSEFRLQCSGKMKILETSSPTYTPGKYPTRPSRWAGIPPSAGFEAKAQFTPEDSRCQTLQTRYGIDLTKPFKLSAAVGPVSLASSASAAEAAIGTEVHVKLKQTFPYSREDGSLPLDPLFHEEYLELQDDSKTYTWELHVDSLQAYGMPTLSQTSDSQKVKIARKIVDLGLVEYLKPGWQIPYTHLLAEIEPSSELARKAYLAQLLRLFESVDQSHVGNIAFFEFYVGGSEGATIAANIASLSGYLSVEEKAKILFTAPGLLLVGEDERGWPNPGPNTRFRYSEQDLEDLFEHAISAPKLSWDQVEVFKVLIENMTQKVCTGSIQFCEDSAKLSPKIKDLAQKLSAKLKS